MTAQDNLNRFDHLRVEVAKAKKPDYRVGWFVASSGSHLVRCLFEGAAIAEAEKHHSFIQWCDPAVSENAQNALKRARDGWEQEAELHRNSVKKLQADNDLLRKHQNGDVWYYQGDGGDNIESMGHNMVVVIHAGDLRELIKNGEGK